MAKAKKAKFYPLAFTCEDGCGLVVHGKNYEEGWQLDFPGGMKVTCPHGKSVEVGTGTELDALKNPK